MYGNCKGKTKSSREVREGKAKGKAGTKGVCGGVKSGLVPVSEVGAGPVLVRVWRVRGGGGGELGAGVAVCGFGGMGFRGWGGAEEACGVFGFIM